MRKFKISDPPPYAVGLKRKLTIIRIIVFSNLVVSMMCLILILISLFDVSLISPPVQERARMLALWPQAAWISSGIAAANSAGDRLPRAEWGRFRL